MGVELDQRAARLEEGILVVQALLRGETVDSDLFAIEGTRIAPLPPEGTEWWIGGGAPKAIDRAARLGDCWYGNADLTPETAARDIGIYREACARHGRQPVRIPIRKDVFIAESRAEAEKAGDALVAGGYRGFDRAAVAYGDPASVADQFVGLRRPGITPTSSSGPCPPCRPRSVPMGPAVRSNWPVRCAPSWPDPGGDPLSRAL